MVKLSDQFPNNVADFDFHRRQRAMRCYDKAIECGSYWLAAWIAADHNVGEDKVCYAVERECDSAIRNRRIH